MRLLPRAARAPRWLVELTTWSAVAVLSLGLGVVALGVVEEPVPAQAQVAPSPTVLTRTVPASPRPRPSVAPPRAAAALPQANITRTTLGPPPGPRKDPVPARFAAPQDRYAFLVGVTDYRPPTKDTIGSANDVRYIATYLESVGWHRENIRVIVDAQVTGKAIRDGMRWLAARSEAGRTFSFFHYSGHVKQFGGGREALWPVDRAWVPDTDVTTLLRGVKGKAWFDVAGCEAGSFLPGLPSRDVLFTASSKGTEKSYEYPAWGMSVWTGLLFDIAMRQQQADADRSGAVTVGEAIRYASYYARGITIGQRPYGPQTPQHAGDPIVGWTLASPPA